VASVGRGVFSACGHALEMVLLLGLLLPLVLLLLLISGSWKAEHMEDLALKTGLQGEVCVHNEKAIS
jgi:hypothetical protein